jgi:hypothetical protein
MRVFITSGLRAIAEAGLEDNLITNPYGYTGTSGAVSGLEVKGMKASEGKKDYHRTRVR